MDHGDSGLKLLEAFVLRGVDGSKSHIEIIEHWDQFLQQRFSGVLAHLLPLPCSPFFEVLKVSGQTQHLVPVFLGFVGALLKLLNLLGSELMFFQCLSGSLGARWAACALLL